MSAIVTVAPREITDLAYRALRVAGVDAGRAKRTAQSISYAEIQLGGGVESLVVALANGHALAIASAPDQLIDAELLAAPTGGPATVRFDPPIPAAAITGAVIEASRRGWRPAEIPASGTTLLEVVTMSKASDGITMDLDAAPRRAAAADGIAVPLRWWAELEAAASAFLVSEAILDEADQA